MIWVGMQFCPSCADAEGLVLSESSPLPSNQCLQYSSSPVFSPSLLILFSLCGLPGMFCGEWGLSSPSGPCWPGFFCTAGIECSIRRAKSEKVGGCRPLGIVFRTFFVQSLPSFYCIECQDSSEEWSYVTRLYSVTLEVSLVKYLLSEASRRA